MKTYKNNNFRHQCCRFPFRFLIPQNKVGRNNICFADFLFKYFEDLDRNVFTANHTCLFITGKELMMDNMPKIIGVPMGSTALFGVGRTVASWLKLPNPDNFTSHVSFRSVFFFQKQSSMKEVETYFVFQGS